MKTSSHEFRQTEGTGDRSFVVLKGRGTLKNKKRTLTIIAVELIVIGILFLIIGYRDLKHEKSKSVVKTSLGAITCESHTAPGGGPEGGLSDVIYTSACSYRVQSA